MYGGVERTLAQLFFRFSPIWKNEGRGNIQQECDPVCINNLGLIITGVKRCVSWLHSCSLSAAEDPLTSRLKFSLGYSVLVPGIP